MIVDVIRSIESKCHLFLDSSQLECLHSVLIDYIQMYNKAHNERQTKN